MCAEATEQARRAAERRLQAQEEGGEEEGGGDVDRAGPESTDGVVAAALAGDFGADPSALHGMAELLE